MTTLPEGFISMVRLPDGAIALVRADGARVLATMDALGTLWVDVRKPGEPTQRLVHDPKATARRAQNNDDDGSVRAPTSGVLRSLTVAVGDTVAPGAVLGHVEAMKMQLELRAAAGGTIVSIDARAGDRVERGVLILRLAR
jgi:biotin carboxyl carrier protein